LRQPVNILLRTFFLVLSIILFHTAGAIARETADLADTSPKISKESIQGAWTSISEVEPLFQPGGKHAVPISDRVGAPGEVPDMYRETLLFKEDSIWTFCYPCVCYSGYKFYLRSDSIRITNSETAAIFSLDLVSDTLFVTSSNSKGIRVNKYIRALVDSSVIKMLKKEKVNPACLVITKTTNHAEDLPGTWYLYGSNDTQGETPLKTGVDIPFTPPDSLVFKQKDITPAMAKKGRLFIYADGKKRECHYRFTVALYHNNPIEILEIEPVSWKNKEGQPAIFSYRKQ
jgi:hypothetical protein